VERCVQGATLAQIGYMFLTQSRTEEFWFGASIVNH
jgi:hypothetical protein